MKLVFEKDIPELRGKTWREKMALRRQARLLDKRIPLRTALLQYITAPLAILLLYLWRHQILHPWILALAIYVVVAVPLGTFLAALWVNPLLAQALRSTKA